jgi:NADPH-dependent 2,4-dienoyl-CoA reductase/sulfur reductase-like enzyme
MEHVTLPQTRIPVLLKTDVVVIDGGPAGFAAAWSADRQGARGVAAARVVRKGGLLRDVKWDSPL